MILGPYAAPGRLSIDLPPGVAVVGGRRTLSAEVDYVLQPAADGSGDVVMLEGADPIIVPAGDAGPESDETAPAPSAPVTAEVEPVAVDPIEPARALSAGEPPSD